jgi:SAM-dependent methyltransferase
MTQHGIGCHVMIGIPTLSTAKRSVPWTEALCGLQMGLGTSAGRVWIQDETIANARIALCREALRVGADYLFMLGDDVLPPPNTILTLLSQMGRELPDHEGRVAPVQLVSGVYWSKSYPPEPYIWRGRFKGSYRDWKAGELLGADFAGCDCLLIDTALLRRMPEPWFSTDYAFGLDQPSSPIATEDYYFFAKAKAAGATLFVDTAVQCLHEDRATGTLFGLTAEMPQAGGVPVLGDAALRVADLGCGTDSPFFGPNVQHVRFDAREAVRPDVRCELHAIPTSEWGSYDVAYSRHVLEHFGRAEVRELVAHWCQLLRPGGKLVIEVPNLDWALQQIQGHTAHVGYAWQQLYGGQAYSLDFHKIGFTARKLRALLATIPQLADVTVEARGELGENLHAEATLRGLMRPELLAEPEWDAAPAEAMGAMAVAVSDERWSSARIPPPPEPDVHAGGPYLIHVTDDELEQLRVIRAARANGHEPAGQAPEPARAR